MKTLTSTVLVDSFYTVEVYNTKYSEELDQLEDDLALLAEEQFVKEFDKLTMKQFCTKLISECDYQPVEGGFIVFRFVARNEAVFEYDHQTETYSYHGVYSNGNVYTDEFPDAHSYGAAFLYDGNENKKVYRTSM